MLNKTIDEKSKLGLGGIVLISLLTASFFLGQSTVIKDDSINNELISSTNCEHLLLMIQKEQYENLLMLQKAQYEKLLTMKKNVDERIGNK
jgi:hypothetical protein